VRRPTRAFHPPRRPLQVRGEKVVVKVQRPGLKELFDIDLKNVRVLAQLLQKVGMLAGTRLTV
jgi:predicted unusual protein kinase regulating ubiquinone biosynthesis (AarF/ABC1/UbiB family)